MLIREGIFFKVEVREVRIDQVVDEAKRIAAIEKGLVVFEFNGVIVKVVSDTDSNSIARELNRANFGLTEKIIGPYPDPLTDAQEKSYRKLLAMSHG